MPSDTEQTPRERIFRTATQLLADGGREAVTTRGVCAGAGVQPQTIYRHFGDMRALLARVAEAGFDRFLSEKRTQEHSADPVEQLHTGWDLHIDFALQNPAVYTLMFGERHVESRGPSQVYDVLRTTVERAGAAGRLVVPVEVATGLIYATGIGVAITLITNDADALPPAAVLSATTRDAVLTAVTGHIDPADRTLAAAPHAIALAALLNDDTHGLTDAESALMRQWLHRVSVAGNQR